MADNNQVRISLEPPTVLRVSPGSATSARVVLEEQFRAVVNVAEKGAKGDTGSPGAATATTSLPFSNITSTPTTLNGYGIQDGLTSTDAAETYVSFSEANNAFAARTVSINPGTGLTGGGTLALNRTLSLTSTGVAAGTYGSPSSVPVVTIDSQGRVTSASNASFSGVSSLSQLSDVQLASLSQGDLISYNQSNLKWINIKQSVVTDGGNF